MPDSHVKEEEHFEVLKENWLAVGIFMRCQTQWNTSMAGVTGLNYQSILAVTKLYGVDDPISVFEDIQVMEAVAIGILNKEVK